jgi:hypothetical protein
MKRQILLALIGAMLLMNHIQRKLRAVSRAGLMKFIYEHRVNDSFG